MRFYVSEIVALVVLGAYVALVLYRQRRLAVVPEERRSMVERSSAREERGIPLPLELQSAGIPSPTPTESSETSGRTAPLAFCGRPGRLVHSPPSAGEAACAAVCRELFPNEVVYYNYRAAPVVNPDTGRELEFDIFFPNLLLAIEYNGRQHYAAGGFAADPYPQIARDHVKAALAYRYGICLVVIPYTYEPRLVRGIIEAAAAAHVKERERRLAAPSGGRERCPKRRDGDRRQRGVGGRLVVASSRLEVAAGGS